MNRMGPRRLMRQSILLVRVPRQKSQINCGLHWNVRRIIKLFDVLSVHNFKHTLLTFLAGCGSYDDLLAAINYLFVSIIKHDVVVSSFLASHSNVDTSKCIPTFSFSEHSIKQKCVGCIHSRNLRTSSRDASTERHRAARATCWNWFGETRAWLFVHFHGNWLLHQRRVWRVHEYQVSVYSIRILIFNTINVSFLS